MDWLPQQLKKTESVITPKEGAWTWRGNDSYKTMQPAHGKAGFEPGSLILDTELLPTSVFPSQVFSLQSTKRLLPFTSFLFIKFNTISFSL